MNKLTKIQIKEYSNLPTKSSKIRYLSKLEYSRVEISKYMNIRYQHVRNVLITPLTNKPK